MMLLYPSTRLLFFFYRTGDKYFFHVESSLRAFLLKISVCDAMLKSNPAGKFFILSLCRRRTNCGEKTPYDGLFVCFFA